MNQKKYKVLLVDDHPLILNGLQKILYEVAEIDEIVTSNNGMEALHHPALFEVDLVIADIEMPDLNGIQLLSQLKTNHPEIKVMMLTMHGDPGLIRELIALGADGYMQKSEEPSEIKNATLTILNGDSYFSQRVLHEISISPAQNHRDPHIIPERLTRRELEILALIAEGLSSKEIADQLFLSIETVHTHRRNLMRKLDIRNTAGLTRFAIHNGLV